MSLLTYLTIKKYEIVSHFCYVLVSKVYKSGKKSVLLGSKSH